MSRCRLQPREGTYKARSGVRQGQGSGQCAARLLAPLALACTKTIRSFGCTKPGRHGGVRRVPGRGEGSACPALAEVNLYAPARAPVMSPARAPVRVTPVAPLPHPVRSGALPQFFPNFSPRL